MSLTQKTQAVICKHFAAQSTPLGLAVDATCGNGHDTEFLAALGFRRVLGFDIQEKAIRATGERIRQAGYDNVSLLHQSHESIQTTIEEPIDCAMFNFGYLPLADKQLTTTARTSLIALRSVVRLLSPHGLITLMCYPGHLAGLEEKRALQDWFKTLHDQWLIETHLAKAPKPEAPVLFVLKPKCIGALGGPATI